MKRLENGYVQVYTGNGKGKTTASLGLVCRAVGAGLRVFIGQFTKSGDYSECNALKRFDDLVTLKQYGSGRFLFNGPTELDFELARKGLDDLKAAVFQGNTTLLFLKRLTSQQTTNFSPFQSY